jgi:hypothetical protein
MPRRAEPGDRAKIEDALSPTLAAALKELCEMFLLSDWQQSGVAAPFQLAAVLLDAGRIAEAEGRSEKDSIDAAAIRMGLSAETARSRIRDWYAESRRGGGCSTPTRKRPPGSLGCKVTTHDTEAA